MKDKAFACKANIRGMNMKFRTFEEKLFKVN